MKRKYLIIIILHLIFSSSFGQTLADTLKIAKSGLCEALNSNFYKILDRGVKEIFFLNKCDSIENIGRIIHINNEFYYDTICNQKFDVISYNEIHSNESIDIYFCITELFFRKDSMADFSISLIGKNHKIFDLSFKDYEFCRMTMKLKKDDTEWVIVFKETTCNE